MSYWEETNIWGYVGEIHTKRVNWINYNKGDIVEQSKLEDQFADHKSQREALIDQIIEDQEGQNGDLNLASKGCKLSDQRFYCYSLTIVLVEWNRLD